MNKLLLIGVMVLAGCGREEPTFPGNYTGTLKVTQVCANSSQTIDGNVEWDVVQSGQILSIDISFPDCPTLTALVSDSGKSSILNPIICRPTTRGTITTQEKFNSGQLSLSGPSGLAISTQGAIIVSNSAGSAECSETWVGTLNK